MIWEKCLNPFLLSMLQKWWFSTRYNKSAKCRDGCVAISLNDFCVLYESHIGSPCHWCHRRFYRHPLPTQKILLKTSLKCNWYPSTGAHKTISNGSICAVRPCKFLEESFIGRWAKNETLQAMLFGLADTHNKNIIPTIKHEGSIVWESCATAGPKWLSTP